MQCTAQCQTYAHTCRRDACHEDQINCLICGQPCRRADHADRHECPVCGGQWDERSRHVFLPSPMTGFHEPA